METFLAGLGGVFVVAFLFALLWSAEENKKIK